jgi:hypothetical protein
MVRIMGRYGVFRQQPRLTTNLGDDLIVAYTLRIHIKIDGDQLTNIRAGLEAKQWSAVLFVNNVANKHAHISDINIDAENLADYNRIAVSQPLTAGIDLNYRFRP